MCHDLVPIFQQSNLFLVSGAGIVLASTRGGRQRVHARSSSWYLGGTLSLQPRRRYGLGKRSIILFPRLITLSWFHSTSSMTDTCTGRTIPIVAGCTLLFIQQFVRVAEASMRRYENAFGTRCRETCMKTTFS